MRIAIVHDWINGLRGGEKCLNTFLKLYPQADVYTLLHKSGTTLPEIDQAVKGTSFLQSVPGTQRFYRWLLALYPLAVKSLSIKNYDLVISTSHAAAKNVSVPEDTVHICYCFTPMRYIWDQSQDYLGRLTMPAWPLISVLRSWDVAGSRKVDHFVAISRLVAARIRCFYKRRAEVIYPAVDTSWIKPNSAKRADHFLVAGALVPYKRVELAILACRQLGLKLKIAGSGPELQKLKKLAGSAVEFLGQVSDQQLADLYACSRALIFPGKEDFGMVPVEAQAAGCPVIAYKAGGARETVNAVNSGSDLSIAESKPGGVFFRQQTVQDLAEALKFFILHEDNFSAAACIQNSLRFSPDNFVVAWNKFLDFRGLAKFKNGNSVRLSSQQQQHASESGVINA